jgi:hypothetical protein
MASSESFRLVESLAFGSVCFSELVGTTLTDSTCQAAANDLSGAASCALSMSSCACQVEQTQADSATTFALSGNNIVEYGANAGSQGESIEYCVTGNSMTQRRTLPPGVNYVLQFVKQ